MNITTQNKFPLLELLQILKEMDDTISFDNKNPSLYRQRANLLQQLGLNSIAKYDNWIAAFLEGKSDVNCYNQNYQITLTKDKFIQKYDSEKNHYYYEQLLYILSNDENFLSGIDPIHFLTRGGSLKQLGLFNLSLRDHNDALKNLNKYPAEYALACLNKSLLLMLCGDYANGFKLYEKRWETNYLSFSNPYSYKKQKQWNGEDIGKDILLIDNEQGIGDNIQFIRYAIILKQQGLNIIVNNNKHINDFLKFNLAKYGITTTENRDEFNYIPAKYWVKMMSLPYLCKTRNHNIPLTSQYLYSSPAYIEKWKEKLPIKQNFTIGFVYSGSKDNPNYLRNIPLEQLKKLFSLNINFICLQKEIEESEISLMNEYDNVTTFSHELNSFFDTSAIIEQCDLVITVDTSVAHLAAAMGKPTWILINYIPDFRWGLNTDTSIWYQSVKLFRQNLNYDWSPVIEKVYQELFNIKSFK